MDCAQLQDDLCAYVDNELDPDDRSRVEAHVGACEACAEELSVFRSIKSLVSRLRLVHEDVPETVRVLPDTQPAVPRRSARPLMHRPLRTRWVALAAAAVLVGLFLSWRGYEGRYIRNTQRSEAVVAHLRGVTSLLPDEPGPAIKTTLRPVDDELYALREGATRVGHGAAFQTVYLLGPHAISQFRFPDGNFDDSGLERQSLAGREYRVGCCGDFAIASYWRGPVQIVLVSKAPPEALLVLAQNIPPDTPFETGY